MFESILQGQAEIRTELVGIKTRLESTELAINNFASCLNNIEINAKHLKAQTGSIETLYATINTIQGTLQSQHSKLVDLEDHSRRSNLILGIPDMPNQSESALHDMVIKEVFQEKLQVTCYSVARIHRLGKPSANRPIILYFQDYREKEAVLRSSAKLKGTRIYVQNYYCADTLRKHKLLWASAKEDKEHGKRYCLFTMSCELITGFTAGMTVLTLENRRRKSAMK